MTEIVGACLSQFHDDENSFELLLAYADGREIGHLVSRAAAQRIAAEFANEFPTALASQAQSGETAPIQYRHDEGGFVEFINRDGPYIVRDIPSPAAILVDMETRQVIGYRVYDPGTAAQSGEKVAVYSQIGWANICPDPQIGIRTFFSQFKPAGNVDFQPVYIRSPSTPNSGETVETPPKTRKRPSPPTNMTVPASMLKDGSPLVTDLIREFERARRQWDEFQKTGVSTAAVGSYDLCFSAVLKKHFAPAPETNVAGRWRVIEAATAPGYWGIELEDADNDDDAILYPQKIHRDTVARIVEAHNAALATSEGSDNG